MRPARILIFRGGAVGDFMVTLPAIRALRKRWPDGHIELIGYPHVTALAAQAGLVNTIRSLEEAGMARFFSWNMIPDEKDVSYFSAFDIVINYLHDPEGVVKANLKRCGVQVLISASPMVVHQHAVDHFLKPLESLAIYEEETIPTLLVTSGKDHLPKSISSPWVALHPGSGGRNKMWPLQHFIVLAERLRAEMNLHPVFITGDVEQEYIPEIDKQLGSYARLHSLNLTQLAGCLGLASYYIGNDSGITHLAAAIGTPTLALFGPSNETLWAPRGRHVHLIKSHDGHMESIESEDVWRQFVAWKSRL